MERDKRFGAPGGPAARLVIRLLGQATVTLDGRPLPDLATPRVQRLLARLARSPDGSLRRDRLAWDLWPDSTDSQARTNLRKLLHDVRRSLPEADRFLEIGTQTLRWRPNASISVDVVELTERLAAGDRAAAVDHYRGPLLPACYDDWVLAERDQLRQLTVDALLDLALAAADEGRDDDAVGRLRHLLDIDPLHEQAYRLSMEALARRGDRTHALRAYHRCAETLRAELGVDPDPATTAVYERLRRQTTAERVAGGEAPAPLLGREHEWQAAWDAWSRAVGGSPRVLLVTGEAGIGKTRLVEELARVVAAEGHAVARTRAYEAAGGLPWGPVIDWLRSEALQPRLADLDGVWIDELARLLPELRPDRSRDAALGPAIDPARRHRLLEAVRQAIVGRDRALLLVLDDLPWCDADTLELCGYLIQASPDAPLLIAATARDDRGDEPGPLLDLEHHLAHLDASTIVSLERLDPDATAAVGAHVSGASLDAEAAALLWKETEGNPLFVVEAMRAGFGTIASPSRIMTPTVRAVISARLDRLAPETRRLVDLAATIGREFAPDVLAAASGQAEDDIADALDELWQRRIVVERGHRYDFTHDKLREVALATISPALRRKLHRSVAAALAHQHDHDLGPVSARLAAHYEHAGLEAEAVEAYERAADHAYRVFALDDAIALVTRALRLLEASPRGGTRDEVELRLRTSVGVALVARRGYGATEVRRNYERALTLHRRHGRIPSPSVLRGLALHAVVSCDFARAGELGQQLVSLGEADHTAQVEGHYVLGVTRFWTGDFAESESHLVASLEQYRPEDAPLHIARYAQDPKGICLCRLALLHHFQGRREDAQTTISHALRYADELDHPMTTGYVRAFHALLAALAPDRHDLTQAVSALEAVVSTMHIGYFETMARLLGGWRDVLAGDLGGAKIMQQVTDQWRHEQQLHLTMGLSLLAQAHLSAGDGAAGQEAIAAALEWTHRTDQRYLLAELLRIDGALAALGGDTEGAVARARQAIDVADAQGSPWLRDRARATLAGIGAGEPVGNAPGTVA